ncbi:hypothetical protein SAMN04515671_3371 [Nakamurella panacisegetis]|uniref:DUF308 domain-containing protein n=1 Tax=Nakamurella panacisegetis TaxID=1090615 RepID=A0A1H0R4D9_9ACTN|nr:hypothetical protein [Nakamurella panacisegetis]SDP23818.1 hypothetical protein SAMN04515671_3371 [Nakamurella panacisegetis]
MSTLPPDDADPTNRERSAAEVDAEFAAIVSGIASDMVWASTPTELDDAAIAEAPAVVDLTKDPAAGADAAKERERRRALRRALRAEEVALFEATQAEAAAQMQADDEHFVPPEPPPVPKPKRRTVVALLFMALGVFVLVRPDLLQVSADVALVLALVCLVGGFAMLIYGLRPRAADPDDAQGWDDGARL